MSLPNLTQNAHDPGTSYEARHLGARPQSPHWGWVGYVDGHAFLEPENNAKDGVRKGTMGF